MTGWDELAGHELETRLRQHLAGAGHPNPDATASELTAQRDTPAGARAITAVLEERPAW